MAASQTSVVAESWGELMITSRWNILKNPREILSIILNIRGHQMYMYFFSICAERAGGGARYCWNCFGPFLRISMQWWGVQKFEEYDLFVMRTEDVPNSTWSHIYVKRGRVPILSKRTSAGLTNCRQRRCGWSRSGKMSTNQQLAAGSSLIDTFETVTYHVVWFPRIPPRRMLPRDFKRPVLPIANISCYRGLELCVNGHKDDIRSNDLIILASLQTLLCNK